MWWKRTEERNAEQIEQTKINSDNQAKLDALSDGTAMIEFTPDGTVLTANQNFQDAMGYSLSDIKGKHHRIFCTSEYANSREYQQFWSKLARGEAFSSDVQRVDSGGNRIWLDASYNPVKDDQGRVYKVVKLASDITRLVDEKHNIQGMLDALGRSMATIEFSPDGTIITANDNFFAATGYTLEEIKGQHHRIFCPPHVVQSTEYNQFWRELNQGIYQHGRVERVKKNGDILWLEASYNPIYDAEGKLTKIMKIATDVTQIVVEREQTVDTALKASVETDQIANDGDAQIKQAIQSMEKVKNELSESADNVSQLSGQSQEISNIVHTINEIADQTNLLALNAAIEAARAGEQGRGFAVVADEVRQLASRTSSSTSEIEKMVQENNRLTNTAVKSISTIRTYSDESLELIRGSGEYIIKINDRTNDMVNIVKQIST